MGPPDPAGMDDRSRPPVARAPGWGDRRLMESFFFKVEHDLLRSDSFKTLGGSAIKVYLVVGLYADFGTGWAYPSIRTIAKQAGLSRQTVLAAIEELAKGGLLATSKSRGKSTAYQVLKPAPGKPSGKRRADPSQDSALTGPNFFGGISETVPVSLAPPSSTGSESLGALAHFLGPGGPDARPKQEPKTREDNVSIPIPGTPFRMAVDGRLVVAADLQDLLKEQGIPKRTAERLTATKAPEDVAKVLLNALYLQSQGKLQNGPGYIRAGIEAGYELLPQVASRLESRRRELESQTKVASDKQEKVRREAAQDAENAAIALVIESLPAEEVDDLVRRAVVLLPEPIVRRNPTLSNPFVRGKVYELAGGDPLP